MNKKNKKPLEHHFSDKEAEEARLRDVEKRKKESAMQYLFLAAEIIEIKRQLEMGVF